MVVLVPSGHPSGFLFSYETLLLIYEEPCAVVLRSSYSPTCENASSEHGRTHSGSTGFPKSLSVYVIHVDVINIQESKTDHSSRVPIRSLFLIPLHLFPHHAGLCTALEDLSTCSYETIPVCRCFKICGTYKLLHCFTLSLQSWVWPTYIDFNTHASLPQTHIVLGCFCSCATLVSVVELFPQWRERREYIIRNYFLFSEALTFFEVDSHLFAYGSCEQMHYLQYFFFFGINCQMLSL